jgi:hypothetical protein
MAKRKKNRGADTAAPSSHSGSNMHLGIDSAENGFTIRVSGNKDGNYHEKTFIATSPRQAFRVAAAHMPTMGKKKAGKKSRGKKYTAGKKV